MLMGTRSRKLWLKVICSSIKLTRGRVVMVNLNCQADEIWNHHGNKPLGMCVGAVSRLG